MPKVMVANPFFRLKIAHHKATGKSCCDGRDMPTVAPTIARIATVGEVEAESRQNPPNLDTQFFHRWMWYSKDCRFKMADF
jgi:hypothetical protein